MTVADIDAFDLIKQLSPEGAEGLAREVLVTIAQKDDGPEGFASFYELVHGNPLPDHAWEWIEHIYKAKAENVGSLDFAWRGSWKTTTIGITFTTFRIGKEPQRANLVIGANGDSANKITSAIADLIANNGGFKDVFPHIEPDYDARWGEQGYDVKDTSISYSKWKQKNSARKDPTLLGLGIGSKSLIGKHPDGVLLLDDIHDEENTQSEITTQSVVNKLTGTILPFIVEDDDGVTVLTWMIAVGTPWREDDAYHYMKNTGEFSFQNMPLIQRVSEDEEGEDVVVIPDDEQYTDIVGRWRVKWPEKYTGNVIVRWRRRVGRRDFARMYKLDLDASKETGMKYQSYPQEVIDYNLEFGAGVDFASIRDRFQAREKLRNRSYFAICYGCKLPTGGIVVVGGDFGHKTQAEGEAIVERVQNSFKRFRHTIVEDAGSSQAFIDILQRKPSLRIIPKTTGGKAKHQRQENAGAWLEMGIVRISDADTPFLNTLRVALDNYPDGNDDVRDALVNLLLCFPEELQLPDDSDIPEPRKRERKNNPFFAMAKM